MAEITLLVRAEGDVLRIYAECEERTAGSGENFAREVEKTLALLAHMPRLGRLVGPPYRRLRLSRFPYALLYSIEGERVMIQTVISHYASLEMILRELRR